MQGVVLFTSPSAWKRGWLFSCEQEAEAAVPGRDHYVGRAEPRVRDHVFVAAPRAKMSFSFFYYSVFKNNKSQVFLCVVI